MFLDLKLPKIKGIEILRAVEEDARTRAIPAGVMTSSAEDRDRIESDRLGVNSRMTSPTPTELDILMIEDSPRDAELIALTLRRAGIRFAVRCVERETTMREALAERRPDIILADYRMPYFDGMSALRVAREVVPDVPFILVSGAVGEERAVEALHEGAIDYVTKDRPGRLPAAVERAIRERAQSAARAAMEAALVESEQRLRLAMQATCDVIWDWNVVTDSVHVSSAMRDAWGIDPPPRDLAGWLALIHPDDRERVAAEVDRWLASSSERAAIEYRLRRGDGTYGVAVARALAIRDAAGAPVRFVGAIQDVTESRRLQEQLARASRVDSLGRLAATVAHEFNNVLMGIQGYAEAIRRQGDARAAELAQAIAGSIHRGHRIVSAIQHMTRAEQTRAERFELNAWLESGHVELAAIAGEQVELAVHAGPDPVWVHCDPLQLRQVLANLIANARDAMPAGGRVVVSVRCTGESAELSVTDSGHGMPPDVAARVFEPLFTTKRTGTGIGLAVSHNIIAQNGGTIEVDTAVGRGTTFRIVLPLWSDEVNAVEAPPEPHRVPRRVLIVEDDAAVAEGLRMLLAGEGIEATVVDRGSEAEAAVETTKPDVVLLDVCLGDMDGTEVFDRLNARWRDLPVVFASGHVDQAALGRRMTRSNVSMLRKPFSLDELLDVLENIA